MWATEARTRSCPRGCTRRPGGGSSRVAWWAPIITFVTGGVCEVSEAISRRDDSAGAPARLGGPRATRGLLSAPGRTRSRLEPAPHIQLRRDIVRISRAHAEPDVLMADRIPALLADHPTDDAV